MGHFISQELGRLLSHTIDDSGGGVQIWATGKELLNILVKVLKVHLLFLVI